MNAPATTTTAPTSTATTPTETTMTTPTPTPSSPDRGAAAVEFALVLPILMLLIFGIIEFGRGYSTRSTLTHAAREGVRAAALDSGDPATVARDAAGQLDGAAITVTVTPDPCVNGQPVTVTLEYDHDYVIPLFGSGTWTFEESGVMRCGG